MNITTTVKNCKIRSDLKPDDEAMMKAHLTAFTGELKNKWFIKQSTSLWLDSNL